MIDIDTLDVMKRATIAMCDAEVIFQILMDKNIITKDEIIKWREAVSQLEPYNTMFKNLNRLKKLVDSNGSDAKVKIDPEAKKMTDDALLNMFNSLFTDNSQQAK